MTTDLRVQRAIRLRERAWQDVLDAADRDGVSASRWVEEAIRLRMALEDMQRTEAKVALMLHQIDTALPMRDGE